MRLNNYMMYVCTQELVSHGIVRWENFPFSRVAWSIAHCNVHSPIETAMKWCNVRLHYMLLPSDTRGSGTTTESWDHKL